LLTNII